MIYLYWYLGIGVAVFVVVVGSHWLRTKNGKLAGGLLYAAYPARTKLWDRFLSNVAVPVLAAVAVVIGWPIAVYLGCIELFSKKREPARQRERKFTVERRHLQERLTVPQIEIREMITDPLDAVPDLPFGHLNPAWQTFIRGLRADDELWSFSALWQKTWGKNNQIKAGYVLLRGGIPTTHFLTMSKETEDESAS